VWRCSVRFSSHDHAHNAPEYWFKRSRDAADAATRSHMVDCSGRHGHSISSGQDRVLVFT
jgi:hypothetical protein